MQQAIGVTLSYKSGKESPLEFNKLDDVLTYFNHLLATQEAQYVLEVPDEIVNLDQIEINMDAVSVRKLLEDLAKNSVEHVVENKEVRVNLDTEIRKSKQLTYLTLFGYTVIITK